MINRRNGYFNLINGYKTPFVCGGDNNTGKNIYYPNTSIIQVLAVKNFDDELRLLLLEYITKAEGELRTLAGYKFDFVNCPLGMTWRNQEAYESKYVLNGRVSEMIEKVENELKKSHLEYVDFYNKHHHEEIPTWIVVKVVNFSTFIDFLEYSNCQVKNAICELYSIKYEKDNVVRMDYALLIGSIHWLRHVRNACAHNERIYSICRKGERIKEGYINSMLRKAYARERNQTIFDLLIYFKYYLDEKDYTCLIQTIKEMLFNLSKELSSGVFSNIRGSMGIKSMSDLDELLSFPHHKEYELF
ncbi:MAG: Abi family protein [Bacilli bacterium]|nr:Abi family protein [Bacilli bacterium]